MPARAHSISAEPDGALVLSADDADTLIIRKVNAGN